MKSPSIPFFVLVLAAAIALGCGASMNMDSPSGQLKSITVQPSTANAANYPMGLVQFVATGYYSNSSSPVTPMTATWGVCLNNIPTSDVSVSSKGAAQCAAGASGVYTVFASGPPPSGTANCLAINSCGGGCVSGYADLTCP